jgi:ubiquinone/menaquinone biosynthesis C-methylase UbiE
MGNTTRELVLQELTERQKREKEYYEQYAIQNNHNTKVDFSPVEAQETRPWNSYWTIYQLATESFRSNACLLDFGSGPGDNAARFAKVGYHVEGFDISETNIKNSQALFEKYGLAEKGHFQVAASEALPYEDNSFDFIAGIDILHHVDIEKSLKECKRVLKPGCRAVFREPIEVPILEKIRESWPVQLIAPKKKSFELHITEDERKLNQEDIKIIKSVFTKVMIKRYFLMARFDRFLRNPADPKPSVLEKIDALLFKWFPALKYLGGAVILVLEKE